MLFNVEPENAKKSGIYKIKNKHNSKIYIGSAEVFERRFRQHKSRLKLRTHQSIHLQRHFIKYGSQDLVFEILELCNKCELLNKEQYYLDLFKPFENKGFNTSFIAGKTTGYKHSERSRFIMSEKRKGKKPSLEAVESSKKYWLGRKHTPESIEKMKRAQANKSYGPEARRNMSLAHIGHKQTQKTKDKRAASLKGKKINGTLVLNTETGIYYENAKMAANTLSIYTHSTLLRKLNGRYKNNSAFIIV